MKNSFIRQLIFTLSQISLQPNSCGIFSCIFHSRISHANFFFVSWMSVYRRVQLSEGNHFQFDLIYSSFNRSQRKCESWQTNIGIVWHATGTVSTTPVLWWHWTMSANVENSVDNRIHARIGAGKKKKRSLNFVIYLSEGFLIQIVPVRVK